MKALTLWPEWAFAVCCLFKRVENRGWHPPPSLIGSDFMIHAGASIGGQTSGGIGGIDSAMLAVCKTAEENGWHYYRTGPGKYVLESTLPFFSEELNRLISPTVKFSHDRIPLGQIAAQVRLCKATHPIIPDLQDKFFVKQGIPRWGIPGASHWHLSSVALATKTVQCKGAQRIWEVPLEVLEETRFARHKDEWMGRWKELTNSDM